MGRAEGAGAQGARASRELSRALRRLRWSRRPAHWACAPGPARREKLSRAYRSLSGRFQVVRIPYGAIPAAEICAAALAELDRSLSGDPQAALLEVLATRAGRRERLVLAIEDADRMPVTEAMRLKELARRSRGALRLLLVTSGGPESQRLRATLMGSGAGPLGPAAHPAQPPESSLARLRPRSPSGPRHLPSPPGGPASPAAAPGPLAHPAAEEALAALEDGLRRGRRAVALQGPPGMGKTLLLRRLGERLVDAFEPVWVPCMALPGEELLRWILYCRSGRDVPVEPGAAWRREIARPRAAPRGLLLLLDDAGALTPDAASELAQGIDHSDGRLHIAMTLCDTAPRDRWAVLPGLGQIRLETPLTDGQAAALLHARFGKALDGAAIRGIVEEARGVPAALIRGASARLARRGDLAALLTRPASAALPEAG